MLAFLKRLSLTKTNFTIASTDGISPCLLSSYFRLRSMVNRADPKARIMPSLLD
jgi:hypothetical protein